MGKALTDLSAISVVAVNGHEISLHEVFYRQKVEEEFAILHKAVRELVIDAALKARNLQVSDEELQKAADNFRSLRRLFKADDTLSWLQARDMTIDDLEFRLKREILINKLRDAVTQDGIDKYFIENHAAYSRAKISYIRLSDAAMAEEVMAQIEEDEAEFAELARRFSTDEATKETGGFVGWVPRKRLHPQIEALVVSADPDDVLGPVNAEAAWWVIKLHEIAEPELTESLRGEIRQILFGQWLSEQVSKASIEVKMTV